MAFQPRTGRPDERRPLIKTPRRPFGSIFKQCFRKGVGTRGPMLFAPTIVPLSGHARSRSQRAPRRRFCAKAQPAGAPNGARTQSATTSRRRSPKTTGGRCRAARGACQAEQCPDKTQTPPFLAPAFSSPGRTGVGPLRVFHPPPRRAPRTPLRARPPAVSPPPAAQGLRAPPGPHPLGGHAAHFVAPPRFARLEAPRPTATGPVFCLVLLALLTCWAAPSGGRWEKKFAAADFHPTRTTPKKFYKGSNPDEYKYRRAFFVAGRSPRY